MRMLTDNFIAALSTALREQEKSDKANNIQSGYAAMLKETLDAAKRGESITISSR